ncbi:MAG: 3-methyl-2-oxobutanoate dehydrogenase subunit beta, partial [Clostridia bacterium]|nr:3-methyl-2-oxobutanoate dehydrogenase subunit beta [Clostridia bacterium]
KVDAFLSVEMSMGQMVEDVRLAVNGKKPVEFFGRTGGVIPTPDEIYDYIMKMKGGVCRG